MSLAQTPSSLRDCLNHEAAELFIVEGESAALAVTNLRDVQNQAVFAMQGKPMNTSKVSEQKLLQNVWFSQLTQTIGAGLGSSFDASRCRYQNIVILMDPDADGIHSGALLLLFFYRWMPALIAENRIQMVRAPVGQVTLRYSETQANCIIYPDNEPAFKQLLGNKNTKLGEHVKYRGLAGMPPEVLTQYCIAPTTRQAHCVQEADAATAMQLLG